MNDKKDEFTLDIEVDGLYTGYLFLKYDNKKDSALINNGHAQFKGHVLIPTRCTLSTDGPTVSNKDIYLENQKILVRLKVDTRRTKDLDINWITINEVQGTHSSEIIKDFEQFQADHSLDHDWSSKLYGKLEEIISENPDHTLSGNLLHEISNDTVLRPEQIASLYNLLNLENQEAFALRKIASKAFQDRIVKVGRSFHDFELPNVSDSIISTGSYKGKYILVDFWSSWCKPCRAQFPELQKLYNDFAGNELEIIGVSFDTSYEDWKNALTKDKIAWTNLLDKEGMGGRLAEKFGIFSIPSNLLVDKNGTVIEKDIDLVQLRRRLDSIFN